MSDPRAIPDEERPFIPEELVPRQDSEDPMRADGSESAPAGDVPAGGAGADSGAVDSVGIDPDDESGIPDRSPHNDEPGVGTRGGRRRGSGA